MNNKWQINKVGLIDFWYYDEEEFDFLDGRMLLRGQTVPENLSLCRALFHCFLTEI